MCNNYGSFQYVEITHDWEWYIQPICGDFGGGFMGVATIIERKLRSTKVRLFVVPYFIVPKNAGKNTFICCSIIFDCVP